MLISAGPKAIREPQKIALVNGLQEHPHGLLRDLIFHSRNSDRTNLLAITFRYVHPADRWRPIAATLDPILEVEQPGFEVFAVVAPRLPVYPSCRIFPQALIRLLPERHLDVTQQVGEPLRLLLSGSLSDPLQHCSYGFPVLCPAVRRWADFLF